MVWAPPYFMENMETGAPVNKISNVQWNW